MSTGRFRGSSYTATFNIGTYDALFSGASAALSNEIRVGVSSNDGFKVTSTMNFSANATVTMDDTTGSKMEFAGGVTLNNACTWTNSGRGVWTISGDGTCGGATQMLCHTMIVDAGVTIELGFSMSLGNTVRQVLTVNGELDSTGSTFDIGCASGGTVTMGSGADMIGNGNIDFQGFDGTWTNNRATAFSSTGKTYRTKTSSLDNLVFPAWDYGTDTVELGNTLMASATKIILAGILACGDFSIAQTTVGRIDTIKNDTYNPSFKISGDVDCDPAGSPAWTRGTSTITGNGQDADWNWNDFTIEEIILDCEGYTKTLKGNFTTPEISGNGTIAADATTDYTITLG